LPFRRLACPSCEVEALDMHDPQGADRARTLVIKSVPAVAVGGKLAGCCAGCCAGRGPDLRYF
jgi:hypothetical protein